MSTLLGMQILKNSHNKIIRKLHKIGWFLIKNHHFFKITVLRAANVQFSFLHLKRNKVVPSMQGVEFFFHMARFFFYPTLESRFVKVSYYARKSGGSRRSIYWRQKAPASACPFTLEKMSKYLEQGFRFPTSITKLFVSYSHSTMWIQIRTVGTRESRFVNIGGNLTQIGSEQSGLAKAVL